MEVKVRDICLKCAGTGKNALTREGAIQRLKGIPRGGIIDPMRAAPASEEEHILQMQRCKYCNGGYNERWVSINELLSVGM